MKKSRLYFVALSILLVGFALFAFKPKSPKVRQPQIGAHVHPVTKRFLFQKNIAEAKASAERLDHQVRVLIDASSMNVVERWAKSVDLKKLENQYAQDIASHVLAMTEVMKIRRENGGRLKKLHEFDFQNLLRQSDYLLSLQLTSTKLWKVSPYAMQAYKTERKTTSLRPLVASN